MRCSRAALQSFSTLFAPKFLRITTAVLLLTTLNFAAAQDRILGPVDSSHARVLPRSLHPKAKPEYDQGAVEPETNFGYVTLMTSPSPSQQRTLDQLMAEQQDPSSANFHKWLTPEEYGAQFGLSQNDLNKITSWLKAQGFTVVSVAAGRNSIVFSGTATQIEAAFQTQIHHYKIGKEEHFANSSPAKIPAAWSGVVTSIRGLNSFHMKPASMKKQLHSQYYSSFLQSQFLAPGDIATIYDINALYNNSPTHIDGTGQKLAIIGQTDVYLADINAFRSGFGLPAIPTTGNNSCSINGSGTLVSCSNATNLGYVVVGGSDPGTPNVCGDLPEADLDLEWSGAVARNAQIVYVNAPATFDSNCNYTTNTLSVENALTAAINSNVAHVISISYGSCELQAQDDEKELQQANAEGITILNSSGDTGAAGCDGFTNSDNNLAQGGLAVGYPASSQYVTGVGGTAVPFNDFTSPFWTTNNASDGGSALEYVPEQAWNDVDEFAAYCASNPGDPFCSSNGITSPLAAQEVLGIGGGGGGASNCVTETAQFICTGGFAQPAWQTVSIPGQPSARFVPDVSLLATPNFPGYVWCTPVEYLSATSPYDTETTSSCATSITDSVNGIVNSSNNFVVFPSIVGGTSASAPVFAGIVTLLNQYVVASGGTAGLGNINPNLYYLAAYNHNAFHQITTGDSNVYCHPGTPAGQPAALICPDAGVIGYQASNFDSAADTGYNLVTGLGSVDAYNLATAWSASTAKAFTLALPAILTVVNQPISWNGTLTAFNGYNSSVSLTCTGSPCGTVSFTPSTQTPTTTGAAFGLTVGSSATGFSAPVTYNFDVTASDGTLTHTHAVSLTVNTDVSVPTTLSAPPAAHAGQSTSTSMQLTPVGASAFTALVTYTCSGLPADATCSFNPPMVNAGSPATPVTVTIQTSGPFIGAASIARPKLRSDKRPLWLPFSLPLAGMVLVGLAGRGLSRRYKIAGACGALALTVFLVACGGGSSSPPPPVVTVSVTPGNVNTLYPSLPGAPAQTQQFTAVVTPTTGVQTVSQSVTWAVSGGSANGTITSSGLYTAPASLPSPAAVTITATSANPGTPGSATVNLLTPTQSGTYPVTVTVIDSSAVHTTTFNLTVN
jgi:subtilase family serine protease